jgi:hypothetical protein
VDVDHAAEVDDVEAEHSGGPEVTQVAGLVAHLDDISARAEAGDTSCPCRLRLHPSPTAEELRTLALIDPQALPFDPDGAEHLHEDRSIFKDGLGNAVKRLVGMES